MRYGKALAGVVLALVNTTLFASELPRQYFGISGSDAQLDVSDGVADLGSLNGKFGYMVNRFVGTELHMGTSVTIDGSSVDAPSLHFVAPLLRLNLPFEKVNLYSLVGVASVRNNFSATEHYSDLSFGFGMELYGTRSTALSFEYMRYGIDDVYKTFGLGIVHYFDWPKIENPRVGN